MVAVTTIKDTVTGLTMVEDTSLGSTMVGNTVVGATRVEGLHSWGPPQLGATTGDAYHGVMVASSR